MSQFGYPFQLLNSHSGRALQYLASSPAGFGNFHLSLTIKLTHSKIAVVLVIEPCRGFKKPAGFGANWARACRALGLFIAGLRARALARSSPKSPKLLSVKLMM